MIDRTALACIRGYADTLIDARTIPAHSPAVMQDELGIGDLPHLGNIVVFEYVFPFPESCRDSNLISYADLHRRGNEHVPLTLSRWFELLDLSIALERNGLAIRLLHGPLLAGLKSSRGTTVESYYPPGG